MAASSSEGVQSRATVLVVDDDPDIRESLKDLLETEQMDVATACNGREALVWLETHPQPGVVLLDLMMPVMNGWELLWAMKERRRFASIPVVIVSAAIGDARTEGVRFLPKPIRSEDLLEIVHQTVRSA